MPNILIIEDEPKVAGFINKGLALNGYNSEIAYDGLAGSRSALNAEFDAIVLDINLPGINGFEVCQKIREADNSVPILMLSALGTTGNKLKGFDIGADDYLVKPFEFDELLARLKALIKRSTANNSVKVLKVLDLEMDLSAKSVRRGGKRIDLTIKEFNLLELLIRNKGSVLTRSDIAEKIWGITFDTGTNIIDLYIFYLRQKIDKKFDKKLIHTAFGLGYILKEDE